MIYTAKHYPCSSWKVIHHKSNREFIVKLSLHLLYRGWSTKFATIEPHLSEPHFSGILTYPDTCLETNSQEIPLYGQSALERRCPDKGGSTLHYMFVIFDVATSTIYVYMYQLQWTVQDTFKFISVIIHLYIDNLIYFHPCGAMNRQYCNKNQIIMLNPFMHCTGTFNHGL